MVRPMVDWNQHFRASSKRAGSDFGANYDSNEDILKQVQTAINVMGYTPQLVVDGKYGPKTAAGVKWAQAKKGDSVDGIVGDQTLASLGIKGPGGTVPSPSPKPGPSPTPGTGPVVKISTVIAALRQAAQEKGYTLSNTLLSLMIGQLRGAEVAYPGVKSSLGGTNNMGAAQVTKSLQSAKLGLKGWGAFAHKDSDPNQGAYIGWYWIAPSPLEAARHWFGDNWWGPALAKGNPQDATSYATILYQGRYFGGVHPGDPTHDPTSDAGKANIADYAAAIQRGVASSAEMSQPADDPSTITVNPSQFANLAARKITEDLFNKAQSGGVGSAWSYLLPANWDDFVKENGVVWFGPPITPSAASVKLGLGTMVLSIAAGGAALVTYFLWPKRRTA